MATHYTSPSGSATWANSTNISTPCSISIAFANAAAGDTVYLRGGTYTITSSLTTSNSGSSVSPITLKAYTGETPSFSANGIDLIYIENPYWIIDGITMTVTNLPDSSSGDAIINIGANNDANHCIVQNCTLSLPSAAGHDNDSVIHIQANRGNYSTIQNNTISADGVTGGFGLNAIQLLGGTAVGVKVLHNVIHDCNFGVYIKHQNSDNAGTGAEIGYNYIYAVGSGIYGVPLYFNIHDNVIACDASITDPYGGIDLGDNGGGSSGGYNTINHNTIFNGAFSLQYQNSTTNTYNTVTNNINGLKAQWVRYSTYNAQLTLDYNLYISGSAAISYQGTNYSLSGWQTYSSQDAHSLSGAPTYTGGATPSTIAGFALTSGSTGHAAASDGNDMGANVSQVGPQSGASTYTLYPGTHITGGYRRQ